MRMTITNPIPQIRADVRSFEKQLRFAHVVALTRTAQDGKVAEVAEIDRSIDRPTPYTRNAVYVVRATLAKPVAAFGLKDDYEQRAPGTPPVNFLGPQIEGGSRRLKRFEQSLALAGHLPRGWQTVPGRGAKIDGYGNMARSQIIQILSQLRITLVAGFDRNMSLVARKQIAAQRKAGGRFFVVKPGGKRQPGVYQREFFGRNVTPVIIFVRRTLYRRRFDWDKVSDRVVDERLAFHQDNETAKAIATAR
jgi:hypothetical protein